MQEPLPDHQLDCLYGVQDLTLATKRFTGMQRMIKAVPTSDGQEITRYSHVTAIVTVMNTLLIKWICGIIRFTEIESTDIWEITCPMSISERDLWEREKTFL